MMSMLYSGDRRFRGRFGRRAAAPRLADGRHRTAAGAPVRPANEWHYANIDYAGQSLGLLIQTSDEDLARREAQEFCDAFGGWATVLDIRRAVVQ
jgi:hypothetical protein